MKEETNKKPKNYNERASNSSILNTKAKIQN